jgi:site-specific recombinase XerD
VLRRRFEWKYPKTPEQLPIVLTREEILKMIAATSNPKHRLLIELLYSSGLRVGEAVKIRTEDISSEQKTAIIRQGKGAKDRLVILSEKFIADFIAFQQSKKDKSPYVFPSATGQPHISIRTAQKIIENSAKKACIRKRVYCHALRASFATHLLDRGTGMAHIQKLMGHNRVSTTQGYIRLSTAGLKGIRSPMDE